MVRVVEVVRQVARKAQPNYMQAFENGDQDFTDFGITTPLRIAHFLAQALYETGRGTVLHESLFYTSAARLLQIFGVGNHSAAIRPEEVAGLLRNEQGLAERVYGLGNPRKAQELGNTNPGDGFLYRGGGLLQTTGRGNYKRMGDLTDVDFEASPDLVLDPRFALKPALFEWRESGLNDFADKNDIITITRRINGGLNGINDRRKLFDEIWQLVHDDVAVPSVGSVATPDDDTKWLQRALNDLGFTPPLDVDGDYGPATTAAVKWFQRQEGLSVDGAAGPITRAALHVRLTATRGPIVPPAKT